MVSALVSTPEMPATPCARSQACSDWAERQLDGWLMSCFTTRPLAAMLVASISAWLVPTLPIWGKVKVMIWPAKDGSVRVS